jgi:hypothetical protein
MKTWMLYGAGLVAVVGLSARATAQLPIPGGPPVPGGPAAAAAAAAGAPAAPPGNLLGFLCPTPDQIAACKAKFCMSPLGQLLNNGLKPLSLFTGGILGNCCPPDAAPSLADQMKPGAEGLAARIQAEEANAKARRAAARYLGTVPCHVFPGVDKALVDLLRKDTNECVRLEAALSLGRGCCCNKVTIQGLALTVSGSEKDGNRAEKSERVRTAAAASLAHCLACVGTAPPQAEEGPKRVPEAPPKQPEKPEAAPEKVGKADAPAEIQLSAYEKKLESTPMSQVIEDARKALDEYQHSADGAVAMRRSHTMAELLVNVFAGGPGRAPAGEEKAAGDTGPLTPVASSEPPLMKSAAPLVVTPVTIAVPQAAPAPGPQAAPVVPAPRLPAPVQPATYAPTVPPAPAPAAAPQTPTVTPKSLPVIPTTPVAPKSALMVPTTAAPRVQVGTPTMAGTPAVQPAAAPAPAGAVSGISNVPQLLLVLRESIYPEQREWAAERLAAVDGRVSPQVTPALIKAAREDTAPTVQVACVRGLSRLNCNSPEALAALRAMQSNADPRVRHEAGQALAKLGGGTGQAVVPAGYVPSRGR